MRERLITLACAVGALLLAAALFVRHPAAGSRSVALPTTIEHRGNGLLGAWTWLAAEGVRTVSLRERFDAVAKRRDLARDGNLLIVTLPVATPWQAQESRALDEWIRAGNTLLALAALSDRPDWSHGGLSVHNDLQRLTGLDFEPAHTGRGSHEPDSPEAAAARLIEASRGLADTARLLANIVGSAVRPGGAVLFDDEHQGLAAAYDPAKFYNDPRLYRTIGVLAAVWLVWVLGGTRLKLPETRVPAPREAELVRATGGFLARVLRPAAAARRMFE